MVHLKFSVCCESFRLIISLFITAVTHKPISSTMSVFTKEAIFPSIGEEEEFEIVQEPTVEKVDVEEAEAEFTKSKARTAVLAHEAESSILELQRLLGKTNTGTATLDEKDRLISLNSKLSALKMDIKAAKTIEKDTELKLLRSKARGKVDDIKLAMREKDIRRALQAVQFAESVDLAFVIDCTSSMARYISSAKDSIQGIVDRVSATNANMNLRLAIVGYRDISDGSQRFEVLDFVTSIDSFKNFLANLKATGGADTAEDMAGAIQQTNRLSWSHPTKVVFIIADAPCHGTEFHSVDDSFPSGTPGIDIINELQALQEGEVQSTMSLTFGKITSATDIMIQRFLDQGIAIEQVGIEEASEITKTVTMSMRKSIFKTVTAMGKPGASVAFAPITSIEHLLKTGRCPSSAALKEYTISPNLPSSIDWKRQPYSKVKVYRNVRIHDIADLQNPLKMGLLRFLPKSHIHRTDKTFESTMLMRRASSPFSEGEIRLAYHGQLAKEEHLLEKDGHSMVMKSFKHIGKGVNDLDQYLKQMEVSAIAHFLAKEYNKSSYKPSHCRGINVLPVIVVEEVENTNESSGNRRFCTENLLPTNGSEFTKYSNNTGYWDADGLDETLLRFTKYTHDITSGYMIVTDLQGVRKGNTFHLTDPVILCKDILRFGHTNLGEKFIKKCIDSTNGHLHENHWW